jgi:hypothetical protein
MIIEDDKAAKIQELLKQLSTADSFQSVAITRQIREIATESSDQEGRASPGTPIAIKPAPKSS